MAKWEAAVQELQATIKDQEGSLKRQRAEIDERLHHLFNKPNDSEETEACNRVSTQEEPYPRRCQEVKPSELVKLNVGGNTSFVTRRDTLTAIKGSRLAEMFGEAWDKFLARDSEGRIFLDLDPVQFRALLSWLVDVKRAPPNSSIAPCADALPEECRPGFAALCDFLCSRQVNLQGYTTEAESGAADATFGSTILTAVNAKMLTSLIDEAASATLHLRLLYRASQDGFAAHNFHQKCDGHGPTVIVARSQGGYIFGGFTETAWDSSGAYKQCQESFLFRLYGPGVGPSKHVMFQNYQNGIHCHSNHAATFGSGHDMRIFPEGAAAKVAFGIGSSYHTAGTGGNFTFLAEAQQAVVTDWEVFEIQCEDVEGMQLLVLQKCLVAAETHMAKWQSKRAEGMSLARSVAKMVDHTIEQARACSQESRSLHLRNQSLDDEKRIIDQLLGRSDLQGQPDIIDLNISGISMTTFRSTLLWQSESALAAKFKQDWTVQKDEMVEGKVFFDEDPDLFSQILRHLRLGSLLGQTFRPRVPTEKHGAWKRLTEYLGLGIPMQIAPFDSKILLPSDQVALLAWVPQFDVKLLYRASRDGFAAHNFHQKCDRHGPTMIVARSQGGYIFGGFTETAWDSSGAPKQCQESFLFRLSGPGVGPSKHVMFQNYQNGIYCHSNHAATFGGGHDMRIFAEGAAAKVAFSIGNTYQTAGTGGNFTFLAEAQQAVVTDWEVFALDVQS